MGLPLAGTHRPGSLHLFFTKLFGKFATAQWADRVVGPYNNTALSVGADDSVRPQDAPVFTETFGEFTTAQRADVGIGPYGQ